MILLSILYGVYELVQGDKLNELKEELEQKQKDFEEATETQEQHSQRLSAELITAQRAIADALNELQVCWKQEPKIEAVTTRRIGTLSEKLSQHISRTMQDLAENDTKRFIEVCTRPDF